MHVISDLEFSHFQRFIYQAAGISLSPAKKALVCGRLSKRLQARRLQSFGEYFKLLASGDAGEVQTAVDLLTTNETYFFREPRHFELLRALAQAERNRALPFRVWSAASSSGEEAYSIAMVLADVLGDAPWEVMGSDISTRVLERARTGHYPVERTRHIPTAYLKRFCLRGIDEQAGTLLVDRRLRSRVQFRQINLNETLPGLQPFDVIFLRNVMIYFNGDTKRQVVARILSLLKPGGHFCIGHSESLNDVSDAVQVVAPSIYRKP
ncbi:MAG: protein-glutamate O-methyltransferase CheR [Rhizobacter sp.]|nr:protein-glutamate O-methyltransferase CheR [Rhizobacter sp.]